MCAVVLYVMNGRYVARKINCDTSGTKFALGYAAACKLQDLPWQALQFWAMTRWAESIIPAYEVNWTWGKGKGEREEGKKSKVYYSV